MLEVARLCPQGREVCARSPNLAKRHCLRIAGLREDERRLTDQLLPSISPSVRGMVNELQLQLRRYTARSHARRGPPDGDPDDTEGPAWGLLLKRAFTWLTGITETHRDHR